MVTEDYVSFESAKLLKEKGFQAKCTACYHSGPSHTFQLVSGRINYCNPRFSKYKMIPPYNAPTLQMVMKWLREVHNIVICICAYYPANPYELNYRNNKPYWKIRIMNHVFSIDYDSFNTYEEACEAAIKYCLENLI